VPDGYVNETAVTGNTWNKLFGMAPLEVKGTSYLLYETYMAEPSFSISCENKLGKIGFISSETSHCISIAYNGSSQTSYFNTPLITLHNELAGLQGGSSAERFSHNTGRSSCSCQYERC